MNVVWVFVIFTTVFAQNFQDVNNLSNNIEGETRGSLIKQESTSDNSTTEDSMSTTDITSSTTETLDCSNIPKIDFDFIQSSFNITLNWTLPEDFLECNYTYYIFVNEKEFINESFLITIADLNACTTYNISVFASKNNKNGSSTSEIVTTTMPEPFSYVVSDFSCLESESILEVTWKGLPENVKKCFQGYYFQWNVNSTTKEKFVNFNTSAPLDLIWCANYEIGVFPKLDGANGTIAKTTCQVRSHPTGAPTIQTISQDKEKANIKLETDNNTQNVCPFNRIIINCSANFEDNANFSWIIRNAEEIVEKASPNFIYSISIDNLSPFTNYTCSAVVNNSGGESPTGNFSFQTLEDVPSEPKSLTFSDVTSSKFIIKWEEPEKIPGVMTNYSITIKGHPLYDSPKAGCFDDGDINFPEEVLDAHITKFEFTKARAYFTYSVKMYGISGAGNGKPVEKKVSTLSSKPDPVTNVTMTSPDYSKNDNYSALVKIKFEPPCYTNGPFKNYILTYSGLRNNFSNHENSISFDRTEIDVNLQPERIYNLTIEVVTENFTRANEEHLCVETKAGVPAVENISEIQAIDANTASFALLKTTFNNTNGDIIAFAFYLLNELEQIDNFYGFWDGSNESWPSPPCNKCQQLTPNLWNPFEDHENESFNFIIGTGSYSTNLPLEEDTEYWLIVRGLTRAAYRDSHLLHFRTKMLDKINLALILGLVFGIVTFLVLLGFLIYLWRRKQKGTLPPEVRRQTITSSHAIPIQKFVLYYERIKEDNNIIKKQFNELNLRSKENVTETSFAMLLENRRKNRYTNILPFDSTRVTLKIDEDDEMSTDYINASYIKGYSGKIEYIATQGPLETTAKDFWKMVVQENVSIIVMVCQFVEQNKEKCFHYFPNNHETVSFGPFEVKCLTELHFGTHCIRTLQVRKDTEQRDVIHMQFLEWPDFGVPQGTDNMLHFCSQLREKIEREGGLVAVHCSAGVGRSGTLIALDILLQAIRDHRDINIFKTVLDLREQRINMVQTEKQYMFIFSCINDYLEAPPVPTNDEKNEKIYENMEVIRSSMKKNLIKSEKESAL